MSVYKSRRKESTMEFLKVGQALCVYTIKQLKKFPKSFRFNLVNDIYRLGIEINENVLRANAIYMHKNMTEMEYLMRREHLFKAKSAIFAMSGLLTITFDFVLQGNNFLGDNKKAGKIFQEWARLLNTEHRLIKGVIDSDKKRWKSFQSTKPPIHTEEEQLDDKVIDEAVFNVTEASPKIEE